MAHDLEILADGTAAFATAREPAWHRLGQVADGPMTAAEMLDLAHLAGWNVRRSFGLMSINPSKACPECEVALDGDHLTGCVLLGEDDAREDFAVTEEDTATLVGMPGYFAQLRTVPQTGETQILGTIGMDHTPVQNEELAAYMEAIVDTSGAIWETGGSLRGGADVFMTLKLPEGIKVGGVDDVDLYLAGLNNHSGRAALRVITTPVRIVCANTERAALRHRASSYSFRHSQGITGRMAEARDALKITFEFKDAFATEAEAMINTALTNDRFDKLVKAVWAEKFSGPQAEWSTPTRSHFECVQALYRNADTQENIRGTVWAGYQSIIEYLDWSIPVAGKELSASDQSDVRAFRNFTGHYDQVKMNAFTKCQNIVKAAK